MNWRTSLVSFLGEHCADNAHGVEVGVHRGATSKAILESPKNFQLILVDSWQYHHATSDPCAAMTPNEVMECFRQAHKITHQYRQRASLLKMPSTEAAERVTNDSQDFIFIDACHEYEAVLEDSKVWWPKLKDGGIMLWHDYGNNSPHTVGVKRAVDEFCTPNELTPQMAWVKK